jgi:hypothetical protein
MLSSHRQLYDDENAIIANGAMAMSFLECGRFFRSLIA